MGIIGTMIEGPQSGGRRRLVGCREARKVTRGRLLLPRGWRGWRGVGRGAARGSEGRQVIG